MGLTRVAVCRLVPVAAISVGFVGWRMPALYRDRDYCKKQDLSCAMGFFVETRNCKLREVLRARWFGRSLYFTGRFVCVFDQYLSPPHLPGVKLRPLFCRGGMYLLGKLLSIS